jgi:IclR family pca regulon transcriptional regulator
MFDYRTNSASVGVVADPSQAGLSKLCSVIAQMFARLISDITKKVMLKTTTGLPEHEKTSGAADTAAPSDPNFMTSLARGLAVLQAFSDQRRHLTIAQISHRTDIPRASVRRCLHTLIELGYAEADDNHFSLKPKVLTLGYSYLSSTPLTVSAHPYLNQISRRLNESCSLAVLQDDEVLYVGRSAASRIMSVSLTTGSRLPAYCTALGRVLLAHLAPAELDRYFERVQLQAHTERTVVSAARLREILAEVRTNGYALIEEELEIGLSSIAVPVRGATGIVLAALNVGAHAARVPSRRMKEEFLPVLLKGAQDLSILLP